MANNKSYSEKLKDPRWQRKRLEIFQRDEFKCRKCGEEYTSLHVHHKWYDPGSEPWDYPDHALITLCEDCHKDEEDHKYLQSELVKSFLQNGFFNDDFDQWSSIMHDALKEVKRDYLELLLVRLIVDEKFREVILGVLKENIASLGNISISSCSDLDF